MDYTLNCPVCKAFSWEIIGKRDQNESDNHWVSNYQKLRKHVFFKIWHSNKSNVSMERCICKKCGFVIDTPRPDETELHKKYEYLSNVEGDSGALKDQSESVINDEYTQGVNILKLATSHFNNKKSLNILDFGGGDGHILKPMIEMDHNCNLVDYNTNTISGLTHLGKVLSEVQKIHKFDLIICRHVLEHLASPSKTIFEFKDYLSEEGLIYAEVPIELNGTKQPSLDPVTHINFFQEKSFKILFKNAGYKTIFACSKLLKYHGKTKPTAQLMAKIDRGNNKDYIKSYKYSIALINQKSFKERLKRTIKYLLNKIGLLNFVKKVTGRL